MNHKFFLSSLWLLIFLGTLFSLGACRYEVAKQSPPTLEAPAEFISYDIVNQAIFQPHCMGCHGGAGGVRLESYDDVTQHIDRVALAIDTDFMPRAGPLDDSLKELLALWIEVGMPYEPLELP